MKRKSHSSAAPPRSSRHRSASSLPETPSSVQDTPSGRGTAVVSRERALYFATGEQAAPDVEETESWPGYFATAQQLSDNRQAAQAVRKQRQEVEQLDKETLKVVWTPQRPARSSVLTADDVVQKLKHLALQTLAEHVEQLPTLEYIDAAARHQVARAVVKLRRLQPEVLPLFIFPGVTEIDIPDCSNINEETLLKALTECAAHGLVLTVLRLGLCGRCVSDSVIEELGDALRTVEQLQLQGCYRLSDTGCQLLVRRCAPSLEAFEISCNQRITKKSIDSFCELQNLHSLTLSECPQLDDASLESLKSMKKLRKLKLNQTERLTDAFIISLAQNLPNLEEFSIARCSQLTDSAVKGILESCRGLKVLDVSDLHQISDECFEPIREHGHALRRVSMRCCLKLTDVAFQHIAYGANSYLETLEMSSVSQATDASMMVLLEHCASSLTTLDISFCRNIGEDALGVLADGTENLRSLVLWGCTQLWLFCNIEDALKQKWWLEASTIPRFLSCDSKGQDTLRLYVKNARSQIHNSSWSSQQLIMRKVFDIHKAICAHLSKRSNWNVMMELRCSPYQRKKSSRKAKATIETGVRSRHEVLNWTPDEDALLRDGVCQFGGTNWKAISSRIENRSSEECTKRWATLQGLDTVVKRPWSEEEDMKMLHLVGKYGASKWSVIASYLKDRNGKQCRERWHNQLNPAIKKTPWTEEEDAIILRLQAQLGNCWAKITAALPGRTDNSVKNHWHSSLRTLGKCAGGGDASSRGHSANPKRCKSKKKSRKAKATKKEQEEVLGDGLSACNKAARVAAPACVANDLATIAAHVAPFGSSSSVSTADSFASPVVGTLVAPGDDYGLLSPESVSDVDNFDLYMYSCAQTIKEDVMKAQAVIDNLLDPMGMGGYSVNNSRSNEKILNQSFQHSLATWHASDDNLCRSASSDLLSDPTSPAQPPFGLDELLFDSLHDVCGVELQSTTNSIQSAPSGVVTPAYRRPMNASEWGTGMTSLSPTGAMSGSTFAPTSTYMTPNLSPIDEAIDQVDDTLFQIKDEPAIDADDTLFLPKEEAPTDAVTCMVPSAEYDFTEGIPLLDMEM